MMTREYKARARSLMQTTLPPVMLVTFVLVAVGWVMSLLEQRIGASPFYIDLNAMEAMDFDHVFGVDFGSVTLFGAALALVFQLMTVLLNFGYLRYCLNVHRELKSDYSDLFSAFENTGKVLLLWLIEGALLALLSVLLVVPAIIAAYAFALSRRLLCDHPDWSPLRCMRESRDLMRGHKWELFKLHWSFLGWIILMTLIPAAAVYVEPYLGLTETAFYRSLAGDPPTETPEEQIIPM